MPRKAGASRSTARPRARRPTDAILIADGSGWLTRALVDGIVESIERDHLSKRFAALANGISPQTLETALQEGASGAGGPLAVELARRVYQAISGDVSAEMRDLQRLGKTDPRAAHLYLQLKYPEDFGGHVRTAPDEFSTPERQKRTRGMLLDHPPPRMLAEFRAHGWFRIPATASDEDRAAILALLERCERPPAAMAAPAVLTTGEVVEGDAGGDGPSE